MTGMIERFGVLGVFLLMVPESGCIPLPSELTLLFSGFAVHQGWMSLPPAVLAATAGTFVSLPAGARHIPLTRFIALTTIGCALWALGFVLTGMIAASAWATVDSVIGRGLLAVGLLMLAASVIRQRERH
jgi:membrane protein DedA with SNARE-associated domain